MFLQLYVYAMHPSPIIRARVAVVSLAHATCFDELMKRLDRQLPGLLASGSQVGHSAVPSCVTSCDADFSLAPSSLLAALSVR